MDLGLKGKRAIVMAASRGLGYASALGLAREGCHLVICSRDQQRIDAAADTIRRETGAKVKALVADVSSASEARRLVDTALAEYGGLEDRPRLVALNKVDVPDGQDIADMVVEELRDRGLRVFEVSAASGAGLRELTFAMAEIVVASREAAPEEGGPYIDPIHAYGREEGISVTGGFVYRGSRMPSLGGRYLFGDWGTGRLWALAWDPSSGKSTGIRRIFAPEGDVPLNPTVIAQDAEGG